MQGVYTKSAPISQQRHLTKNINFQKNGNLYKNA